MRVTENLMLRNFLVRTAGSLARLARFQEKIASGRNVLRPSDDPASLGESLALRSDLRTVEAYRENASQAAALMAFTESSLAEVSDLLMRAKELLLEGMSDSAEAGSTEPLVEELGGIIDELLLVANREFAGRYLFGGRETRAAPYARAGQRIIYQGDDGDILEELGPRLRVALNLVGPAAFQTVPARIEASADWDPALSTITPLADLLGGAGIAGGRFLITDSTGAVAGVDLLAATTIGDVIRAINNAGLNVTAAIGADGRSIEITETLGGQLQITDLEGGTLAEDLGIATTAPDGFIAGRDLDPALTEHTPTALLFRGIGIPAGSWRIRNDSATVSREALIDPSAANTVGDLLDLLEGATTSAGERLGLEARIEGNSVILESTRLHTTLSVTDEGGAGAALGGVAGTSQAQDVFVLVAKIADAIGERDSEAMDRLLREVDAAIEGTAGVRGAYGARSRQVLRLAETLEDRTIDLTIRLSDVEDADLAQAALELTRAETVYNASLALGTRLFRLNLFDFIR